MRHAFVLAASALLVFLAASSWLALFPGVPVDLGGAPDLDRAAEHVRIPVAGDARPVDGWLLRGTRPGVILMLHGYGRDHHRMWRYAGALRRDGWTLLAIDFRSSRRHDRKPTTLGYWEREDVLASLDWIEREPSLARQRVALFAESLGGSVAIAAMAERPEVAALAVDSPFATGRLAIEDGFRFVTHVPAWPAAPVARLLGRLFTGHDPEALDAAAALGTLGARPVLLVQSGIEDRFGLEEVRMLEAAAGPGAERWCVADAGHNHAWLLHRAEYERRLRAFYRAHLAAPAPQRVPADAHTRHGRTAAAPAFGGTPA